MTSANVAKLYVGIAFISVSKSISQAGFYGAIVGFAYVLAINLYCVYLLLKARNRFKNDKIVDLCDLAVKLYGEKARIWISIILVLTNALYCICYVLFFGTQIDQLLCNTFDAVECGNMHLYSFMVCTLLLPIIF